MNAQNQPLPRPPRRSKASLITLIVLAFLLLAAAVALAISMPEETILPDTSVPMATVAVSEVGFDTDPVEAQKLYPFGQGVVKLTNNRLSYLAIDGSEVFAAEIDMASPYAVISSRRLVAADREGPSFVVIDENGILFRGSREGRVVGVAQYQNQLLALIEDRHNSTGVVSVLDGTTGQLQYECHFPESGYVLQTAFTPDGSSLDVVLANTDHAAVKTLIKRFAAAGEASGQRLLAEDGLFPALLYDQSGEPVLASDSRLIGLAYDREDLRFTTDLAKIEAVVATEAGPVVLASDRLGGKLGLYTLGSDGSPGIRTEVGEAATPLTSDGIRVALGSGTRVLVYDAKASRLSLDSNLAEDIVRVGFSGPDSLTIVTAGGVRRIGLDAP
jgi:hypothetical protein